MSVDLYARIKQLRGPGRTWEPAFPEFATDRRRVPDTPLEVTETPDNPGDWTFTPPTSHVHSIRYQDARKNRLLMKYTGRSILTVRFKPTDNSPMREYNYFFTNHAHGERVFKEMIKAAQPWVAGYKHLVLGKVPYEQNN